MYSKASAIFWSLFCFFDGGVQSKLLLPLVSVLQLAVLSLVLLLPPLVSVLQLPVLSLVLLLLLAPLLLMRLAVVCGSATTRISSLQYPSSVHIACGSF